MTTPAPAYYRHTGTTSETMIVPKNCALIGYFPENTTTGTLTFNDTPAVGSAQSTLLRNVPVGLVNTGQYFVDDGVRTKNGGLSLTLGNAADVILVVYRPVVGG